MFTTCQQFSKYLSDDLNNNKGHCIFITYFITSCDISRADNVTSIINICVYDSKIRIKYKQNVNR